MGSERVRTRERLWQLLAYTSARWRRYHRLTPWTRRVRSLVLAEFARRAAEGDDGQ